MPQPFRRLRFLSEHDTPDFLRAWIQHNEEIILAEGASENEVMHARRALDLMAKVDFDECIFSDDALNLIVERNSGKTGVRSLEQEAERLLSHALYRMEVEGVEQVVYDMDL